MSNPKSPEVAFLNGKYLVLEEARISATSMGFLCGIGLFETMRSFQKKIVYLEEHLRRIEDSAQAIGLDFPWAMQELKGIIMKAVNLSGFCDCLVRLTVSKQEKRSDILVTAKNYRPYPGRIYQKGFSAQISGFNQNESSYLSRLKTASRLLFELAYEEAKREGFDEAIILNSLGNISECSRSNLFFARGKELFTPSLECGCLDGITRRVIFDLAEKDDFRVNAGCFTARDLYQSDEAFLTNSLMGVMPLVCVGKNLIACGRAGRLTRFFLQKYRLLVKHGT